MDDYALLIDLHKHSKRLGPGGDAETRKAIELAGLDSTTPLKVADIGCGTGASTLLLARLLNAEITAVDLFPEFLGVLQHAAKSQGTESKIKTLHCSMEELPFDDEAYDVLWSEGAVYNMGFEQGVSAWKRFLKPDGLLVVSEITWTTPHRPAELQRHWETQYAEVDTVEAKTDALERAGYAPITSFILAKSSWLENYYIPLQRSFPDFLRRHGNSERARAVVAAEEEEIALYREFNAYYGYGMYLARRVH